MSLLTFAHFAEITEPEAEQSFRDAMTTSGYFAFYNFVEEFRSHLKSYSDTDAAHLRICLDRGRRLFPKPGEFSPSWNALWDELEGIYTAKNEVLSSVPAADRDGEWQVLIDNPFLPEQVVCYPSLPFLDAAYMYGYFQLELNPHECLRLQKVVQLMVAYGNKEASILPST